MKTSPRALGTRFETAIVRAAHDAGLLAERLAEGGSNDLGDIRIWTDVEWVLEAKDRERLNLHQALEKALRKSGSPDTALVWRRMIRQPGHQNRHQEGPIIVALTLPRFLVLLKETV